LQVTADVVTPNGSPTAAERAAASPVTQPFLTALDVRTAAARKNGQTDPTQMLCPRSG
jgi:hypothetical protein